MNDRTQFTSRHALSLRLFIEPCQASPGRQDLANAWSEQDLPLGAMRLATDGTILEHRLLIDTTGARSMQGLRGQKLFSNVLRDTPLEAAESFFKEHLLHGTPFKNFTHRVHLVTGPVEVTLLLFYHGITGEAWAFVESTALPEGPRKCAGWALGQGQI